jgi:hypothetical protein
MRSALDRLPEWSLGEQSKLALVGACLVKMHRDGLTRGELSTWLADGLTTADATFTATLLGVVALGAVLHDVVVAAMLFCRPDPNLTNQ